MSFWKKIPAFLDNTTRVVIIFTAVMLVPNVVLAITEPYSWSTVIASLLLPAGFYLLWTAASRHTGAMILAALPLIILGAFQLVISYLFGNSIIAVDMFTNVFTTSSSEVGELLGSIYPSIIIVILLYMPLLLIGIRLLRLKQTQSVPQRKKCAVIGAAFMVLGLGFAGISKCRHAEFSARHHIYPVNVVYNITLAIERWGLSNQYAELSKNFRFDAKRDPIPANAGREIYVFVIGEASRACSWSLFGYERETNPLLGARTDLVLFRNILTESNTTHKSVPMMLSPATARSYDSLFLVKGIPALFNECGFRTAFISNQPPNNSLIDDYAAQADTLICITPRHTKKAMETHPDGIILPHLNDLLNDGSRDNLFIVIHTYGSHANHAKRYPREFARFVPDLASSVSRREREKVRNAYDNTIVYTDYVLSEMISMLEKTGACSALLYCSDHGEDVLDDSRNRFLHASPTTTYYQLHTAAFAWFSDPYTTLHPEATAAAVANCGAPAAASSMFNTMAGIASIRSRYVNPANSLVNPRFTPGPRIYIDDYNRAVNVMRTGLTDKDIEMFDRHGIRYDPEQYRHDIF